MKGECGRGGGMHPRKKKTPAEKPGSQVSWRQGTLQGASIKPPEAPQVVPGGWQNFRFFGISRRSLAVVVLSN